MKILYEAEDGTIFADQYECEDYENALNHENLYTIEFINEDNILYLIDRNLITDEDVYNDAEVVVIHDESELEDFQWLTTYCGWCEFEQIDEPGTWKREEDDLLNAKWKRVTCFE